MITSKNKPRISVHILCGSLIAILLASLLTACSSQNQLELATPFPNSESLPEPTLTPIPTLPPLDGTALLFEEGKHKRGEYCSRVFEYQETIYGSLSIAVADNFIDPQDSQELALKVIDHYIDLSSYFPAAMSHPINVFIIPDPNIGECISRDNFVFVAPEDLASKAFYEALLGAGTGISAYWAQAGLTSLNLGEQPDLDVLKTWYQNTDDLDMAGLFYARFHEDWATEEEIQIARLSATSLVQYALEEENIQPGRLVEEVNNDLRTRWLESFGVNRTVTYPYDGRFAGFNYLQSSDCPLIVQAERMDFCLTRLPEQEYFDEIPELEFFIDQAYYGRIAIEEYLLSEAPSISHLMDLEESIFVQVMEMINLGRASGNSIRVSRSGVYYWVLHEIVHTFNWNPGHGSSGWITEGFATYLGMYLPIYPQTEQRCIYEELNGGLFNEGLSYSDKNYNFPEGTSNCYFLDPEQFSAAKEWYLAQGGQMDKEEFINPRLYADAVSFATIYRDAYGGSRGLSVATKYSYVDTGLGLDIEKGMQLSYTQAAAFLAWQCDIYTIDRVMDVYINKAENRQIDGKTYDELIADWHAYLISKGEGIAIPGKP